MGVIAVCVGRAMTKDIVGSRAAVGVPVGRASCVSVSPVLTVDTAVCMISASLSAGVPGELLQDASRMAARSERRNVLPKMFTFHHL